MKRRHAPQHRRLCFQKRAANADLCLHANCFSNDFTVLNSHHHLLLPKQHSYRVLLKPPESFTSDLLCSLLSPRIFKLSVPATSAVFPLFATNISVLRCELPFSTALQIQPKATARPRGPSVRVNNSLDGAAEEDNKGDREVDG